MEIIEQNKLMVEALQQCVVAMEVALLNIAPHPPRLGLSLAIVYANQLIKLHKRSIIDVELPQ